MREAPVHALVRERNRTKETLPAIENVVWECIGPSNVGGRMTSIVCHPDKPDCIWAGAAAGEASGKAPDAEGSHLACT